MSRGLGDVYKRQLGIENANYWAGNRAENNLTIENCDDPNSIMLRDTKKCGNRSFLDDRELIEK